MQPLVIRDLNLTPFSPASVPSPAMVAWAAGHVLFVLGLAIRLFRTRDL
jgi:Cu-processing system permease protein